MRILYLRISRTVDQVNTSLHCEMRFEPCALLLALAAAENWCVGPWPDYCNSSGFLENRSAPAGLSPCTPYAPPLPEPTDWLSVRAALINTVFGRTNGSLPTENPYPDAIEPVGGNTSSGCWCSTLGNCLASSCTWSSNMTKLVFTIAAPVNDSFTLTLNSTVFWTLNTSGVASIPYGGPDAPQFPEYPMPPMRRSDILVLFHNGHNSPCSVPFGDPDFDGTVDWLNQLGYDVMNLHMPLYQARVRVGGGAFLGSRAPAPPPRSATPCRPSRATTRGSRPGSRPACPSSGSLSSPSSARSTTRRRWAGGSGLARSLEARWVHRDLLRRSSGISASS